MDTIDQESLDLLANIKNTGDGKPVILKFVLAYKGVEPKKMTVYRVTKQQKDKEAIDKKARIDLIKECRTNGVRGVSCASGRLAGDAKRVILQLDNEIYGGKEPVTETKMKKFFKDVGANKLVEYQFINYLFFELCDEWDSYWGQVIPPLYNKVMYQLASDINSPDPENPNKVFAEKLRNAWEVLTLQRSYEPSQAEPKGQSEESLTLLQTAISLAEGLLSKIKDKLSTFDGVDISDVELDRGEEFSFSREDLEDLYAEYERQINEAGLVREGGLGLPVYKLWSILLDKKDGGDSKSILADFAQLADMLTQVDDFKEAQEFSGYLRELFDENSESLSGDGQQLLSKYKAVIAEAKSADQNDSSDYPGTLVALVEIEKALTLALGIDEESLNARMETLIAGWNEAHAKFTQTMAKVMARIKSSDHDLKDIAASQAKLVIASLRPPPTRLGTALTLENFLKDNHIVNSLCARADVEDFKTPLLAALEPIRETLILY